jgi:single-strand DNA-binding protein
MIEGRLQYDQWEKDGQKQSRLLVRAARVQFLGGPRSGGEGAPARAAPAAESSPADDEKTGGTAEPPPASAAGGDDDNLPF